MSLFTAEIDPHAGPELTAGECACCGTPYADIPDGVCRADGSYFCRDCDAGTCEHAGIVVPDATCGGRDAS